MSRVSAPAGQSVRGYPISRVRSCRSVQRNTPTPVVSRPGSRALRDSCSVVQFAKSTATGSPPPDSASAASRAFSAPYAMPVVRHRGQRQMAGAVLRLEAVAPAVRQVEGQVPGDQVVARGGEDRLRVAPRLYGGPVALRRDQRFAGHRVVHRPQLVGGRPLPPSSPGPTSPAPGPRPPTSPRRCPGRRPSGRHVPAEPAAAHPELPCPADEQPRRGLPVHLGELLAGRAALRVLQRRPR